MWPFVQWRAEWGKRSFIDQFKWQVWLLSGARSIIFGERSLWTACPLPTCELISDQGSNAQPTRYREVVLTP
jgi:hypothetical protein